MYNIHDNPSSSYHTDLERSPKGLDPPKLSDTNDPRKIFVNEYLDELNNSIWRRKHLYQLANTFHDTYCNYTDNGKCQKGARRTSNFQRLSIRVEDCDTDYCAHGDELSKVN
ncbi:MAG: hypothetical protein Q9167_007543 [Letrouitia subvulpina]